MDMIFNFIELDQKIKENKFDVMFMYLDTWLKCNKDFITNENRMIYYRKVRVIYFEDDDLLALNDELIAFFKNGGVEAQ